MVLTLLSTFICRAQAQVSPEICHIDREIKRSVKLDPTCHYAGPFVISASNVLLDCNNARIDAARARIGLTVKGKNIRNVTIKNCRISDALSVGIYVRDAMKVSDLAKLPLNERYKSAPNRVTIRNTSVINSGTVGIYVGNYSSSTRIENSIISHSGGAGIYLDASSILSVVRNNIISQNGFGDERISNRRAKREGMAVDSSAYNKISDNSFYGNASGGVFLYKNCWEHHTDPDQVPRWQHSNFNTITRNRFSEKIGVWIASRQTKKMKSMICGDPEVAPSYYRDYAAFNIVSNNSFSNGDTGVIVEDDFNSIVNNNFDSLNKACVRLASPLTDKVFKRPVIATVLTNNNCVRSEGGFVSLGFSTFTWCVRNFWNRRYYSCGE